MNVCTTVGCSGESKLQCPTCVKKGIVGSYFCSQMQRLTVSFAYEQLMSLSALSITPGEFLQLANLHSLQAQECFKSSWSVHKVLHQTK
ncbi:hypothetical protein QYM36_006693, partial [Artemia franciscana]